MIEVKITKHQFDIINQYRYDLEKKEKYIKNDVLTSKYVCAEDTAFITYSDTDNYYLVFEGEIKTDKIQPSSVLPKGAL